MYLFMYLQGRENVHSAVRTKTALCGIQPVSAGACAICFWWNLARALVAATLIPQLILL